MNDKPFCDNCNDHVELGNDQGNPKEAICSRCDKPITCNRCGDYVFLVDENDKLESSVCDFCGWDIERQSDESADTFPNGRDMDAEDEESFGE